MHGNLLMIIAQCACANGALFSFGQKIAQKARNLGYFRQNVCFYILKALKDFALKPLSLTLCLTHEWVCLKNNESTTT